MSKTMIKSRYIPVYKTDGKNSNISFAAGKTGVYMIAKDSSVIYVGYSQSDLQKTVLRHFQSWDDPKQVRVSYHGKNRSNYSVRIVLTTAKRAAALEAALIIKLQPKDNPNKLLQYTGKLPKSLEQILADYNNEGAATVKQMEDAPF